MLTRTGLLNGEQQHRLDVLFNYDDDYAVLQETWLVYQEIIDCYEDPNKRRAKTKEGVRFFVCGGLVYK